jgi:hypothetical protein
MGHNAGYRNPFLMTMHIINRLKMIYVNHDNRQGKSRTTVSFDLFGER